MQEWVRFRVSCQPRTSGAQFLSSFPPSTKEASPTIPSSWAAPIFRGTVRNIGKNPCGTLFGPPGRSLYTHFLEVLNNEAGCTQSHFSSPSAQKSISEGSRKKPITERDEHYNGGGSWTVYIAKRWKARGWCHYRHCPCASLAGVWAREGNCWMFLGCGPRFGTWMACWVIWDCCPRVGVAVRHAQRNSNYYTRTLVTIKVTNKTKSSQKRRTVNETNKQKTITEKNKKPPKILQT